MKALNGFTLALIAAITIGVSIASAAEPETAAPAVKAVQPAAAPSWRPAAPEEAASPFLAFKALGLCIGVLLIGVWASKKFGLVKPGGPARRMKILERLTLNSKQGVVLVEVDGRRLLLTTGNSEVRAIASFSSAESAALFDESLESECAEDMQYSA